MSLLIKSKQHSATSDILCYLAKGEEFMVWCGRHNETPKTWVSGSATLVIKVGRRKRLIRGKLREGYEGHDEGGETYSFYFTPNRARTFPLEQRINIRLNEPNNIGNFILAHQSNSQ